MQENGGCGFLSFVLNLKNWERWKAEILLKGVICEGGVFIVFFSVGVA